MYVSCASRVLEFAFSEGSELLVENRGYFIPINEDAEAREKEEGDEGGKPEIPEMEEGHESREDAQAERRRDQEAEPEPVFAEASMDEPAHEEDGRDAQEGEHEEIVRIADIGYPDDGHQARKGEYPEEEGFDPPGPIVEGVAIARDQAKDADADRQIEEEIVKPKVGQAQEVAGLVREKVPEEVEEEEHDEGSRQAAEEEAYGIPGLARVRGGAEEEEQQGRKTDEE